MIKRTLITPMMTFRALTGTLSGVPPRNFSVFCRSSSRPCQAVRIAFLVEGSCGGQFASRVVGGGVVDVTRLEPGATAAADVAVGKRVAHLLPDARSMVMVSYSYRFLFACCWRKLQGHAGERNHCQMKLYLLLECVGDLNYARNGTQCTHAVEDYPPFGPMAR